MTGTVVPFPASRRVNEPLLTKQQLAVHFQMTTRWVELRTRDGMPSQLIGGRRRFRLSECENWLRSREA